MSPFKEIGVFVDESNGKITRFGNGKLLATGERRDFKNSTLTVVDDETLEVEIRRTHAENIHLAGLNPINFQNETVTTLNAERQIKHIGQEESLIIIPNDSSDPPLGYSLGYIYQWEEDLQIVESKLRYHPISAGFLWPRVNALYSNPQNDNSIIKSVAEGMVIAPVFIVTLLVHIGEELSIHPARFIYDKLFGKPNPQNQ